MSRPAQATFTRLEEIVGGANVLHDPAEIAPRKVDGLAPSVVVRPADVAQTAEIVRFAGLEKLAVIPCGGCTKLNIGSPPERYDVALDLSLMSHVLAYDPQDLTLGVEPGVRIKDLSQILAERNQFLPLAVPFAERATIGGVVATNSSSPLRHAYGGIRDFCLGMEFVTGEGVAAKGGGRVVKNVTGYDLHKLLIGSLGTLGVITRINFRTFPLPRANGTFLASFGDAAAALGFCRAIAHSVLSPQMLEVADPAAARILVSSEPSARMVPNTWLVIISAAGQPDVIDRYAHELGHMASKAEAEEFLRLGDVEAHAVFGRICEFPKLMLDIAPQAVIFRIGIVPTAMAALHMELAKLSGENRFDLFTLARASGILYVGLLPQEGDTPSVAAIANVVHAVFRACGEFKIGASAMLEWCPTEAKLAAGGAWGPSRPDFALMKRIKNTFDPKGVLSPGRFAGGI